MKRQKYKYERKKNKVLQTLVAIVFSIANQRIKQMKGKLKKVY